MIFVVNQRKTTTAHKILLPHEDMSWIGAATAEARLTSQINILIDIQLDLQSRVKVQSQIHTWFK